MPALSMLLDGMGDSVKSHREVQEDESCWVSSVHNHLDVVCCGDGCCFRAVVRHESGVV